MGWADGVTARQPQRASVISDSFAPTDAASGLQRLLGISSDTFSVTDDLGGRFTFRILVSDDGAVLVDLVAEAHPGTGAATPLNYSDLIENYGAEIADLISGKLRLRTGVFVSDGLNIGDTVLGTQRMRGEASDSASFADDLSARFVFRASLSEDAGALFLDIVAEAHPGTGAATPLNYSDVVDALAADDSATARMTFRGTASDAVSLSDVVAALQRALGQFSDSVSVTDDATGRLTFRVLLSDDQGASWADIVAHILQDVGAALRLEYSDLIEALTATDALSGRFTYRASATDAGSMDDLIAGTLRMRVSFADSQSMDDLAGIIGGIPIGASDAFGLTDAASALERFLGELSDTVSQTDLLSGRMTFRGLIADELNFWADLVEQRKVGEGTIDIVAADSVSWADVVAIRGWGITAKGVDAPVKLFGADDRSILLIGIDDRVIVLKGNDDRALKLRRVN